jgi:hypothetical protein
MPRGLRAEREAAVKSSVPDARGELPQKLQGRLPPSIADTVVLRFLAILGLAATGGRFPHSG